MLIYILLGLSLTLNTIIGIIAINNRRYILKQSKGLVDLPALKEEEKDAIDKINKKYSERVNQEFDFMADF